MSVTIVDVKERVSQGGNSFMALIVQNELELVTSKSGNIYVAAHRASIPCTLDYNTAKLMIGKELPGTIEKVECATYEHVNSDGEIVNLNYRYQYIPEQNRTVLYAEEDVHLQEVEEVV
ncbi:hypothetical protein [uncultured Draconibacterium sp.]|uniref:hypothetical protein n=1 Tax=uncultured Draconibacterium sp. TaxID=1573823 RepID=UPI002AA91893|nr:hypothetical protein [uncultured Draconibacterium sp.]